MVDQAKQALAIEYVLQPVQGRSAALNAGIQAGTGQVVVMLDDDEQVAVDWLEVLARRFENSDVNFIGGPTCLNGQHRNPSGSAKNSGQ